MAQETWVQSQVESYKRFKKWYLIPPYKVRSKGKVEQSRERSSALGVVAIENGALGSPSTTVAKLHSELVLYWK